MATQAPIDTLQQLKADLRAKQPQRLYVFHGEESFLLHHYLTQLRKVTLDELTESFNYHRFNNENFDVRDFVDAVENLPMMAQRTLVTAEDIDLFKLSESARDAVTNLLSDIPDYCTVVFSYETLEFKPDKRQKKLWEALSGGCIIDFVKQDQRSLVSWITRHFAAKGKQISAPLCKYLLEITDGTMTSLAGEIEKISAYSDAPTVCKTDIDAVTEPVLDAVVFRMTDSIAAGQYAAALQTLQDLLKMQQEPIVILAAVGNHLRRLSTARTLLDHGGNSAELAKLCAVADFVARKAMDAARRFDDAFFKKAMELVLETDMKMKTSFDDPERLLELLVLRLAQEARRV